MQQADVHDPVCEMKVDPSKAAASVDHGGAKIYFCSQGCAAKFRAAPEKYVQAKPVSPASHSPAKTESNITYTCPMHPEIRSRQPGDCPLCGMPLVPIAGTGAADDSELRGLARRLWIGVALSFPLVVLAMSPMIGIHELFGLQPRPRGWIEFVLGTPVVLWVGWPILRKF